MQVQGPLLCHPNPFWSYRCFVSFSPGLSSPMMTITGPVAFSVKNAKSFQKNAQTVTLVVTFIATAIAFVSKSNTVSIMQLKTPGTPQFLYSYLMEFDGFIGDRQSPAGTHLTKPNYLANLVQSYLSDILTTLPTRVAIVDRKYLYFLFFLQDHPWLSCKIYSFLTVSLCEGLSSPGV